MAISRVRRVDDLLPVRTVLASVSDRRGLDDFVAVLADSRPDLEIYATSGTRDSIANGATGRTSYLRSVSDYTGQPETSGGLVKTLDFKIYLGLLSESYNEAHESDLSRLGALRFDLVVCNFYPFSRTVSMKGSDLEDARRHIDIGGPCMIRAAAKNFLRVAVVTDPADYPAVVSELQEEGGSTLRQRFRLARKAFEHVADYDRTIASYLGDLSPEKAHEPYTIEESS